jgi:hypothetical protein
MVALSSLAASSARTIFNFPTRKGLLLPALRLIGASKAGSRRRGDSCLLRRGICKIDLQRAAASVTNAQQIQCYDNHGDGQRTAGECLGEVQPIKQRQLAVPRVVRTPSATSAIKWTPRGAGGRGGAS